MSVDRWAREVLALVRDPSLFVTTARGIVIERSECRCEFYGTDGCPRHADEATP